jgi:hypothetical protein
VSPAAPVRSIVSSRGRDRTDATTSSMSCTFDTGSGASNERIA